MEIGTRRTIEESNASDNLLTTPRGMFAHLCLVLAVTALPAQNLSAPPWVRQGGVVNAASRLPVNLPGGVLAPGALVEIEGLRFDPAKLAVEIETGGRTYTATVVRAAPESIVAILPKFRLKQPGPARLFVISHGKRSTGSEVVLGSSAFGIFTANAKGWGVIDSPLVHPSTRVTLSGTGLGDAGERSIEVFVGGKRAPHVHVGEKKDGIDHLSFEVPAATPPGCSVPVAVKVGAAVSNVAVLRVGGESGCGSTEAWYEKVSALGERSGTVVLLRSDVILEVTPGKPVPFVLDNLSAGFTKRVGERESGPLDLIPPPGACLTWAGPIDANHLVLPTFIGPTPDSPDAGLDLGPDIAEQTSSLEDLDAGSFLSVTGPAGTRSARRSAHKPRMYSTILGGNPPLTRIPPTPLFLAPGGYRISINGGIDVDPLTAALNVPPAVVWPNRDSTATLDRRLGAELKWTLPAGYRPIVFASNIDRRNSLAGIAVCVPPLDATHFRIPPIAVANLPATIVSGSDLSLGFMGVAAIPAAPPAFAAKGLDHGRLIAASLSGRSVVVR